VGEKMRILCKNMTQAMKANKLLYNAGIYSKVEKITDVKGVSGCVYGINFFDKNFEAAIKIMCEGSVILHKKEKQYYGDECL
jgi:CTP:phosphocholine cytidylyltransferase-like protein